MRQADWLVVASCTKIFNKILKGMADLTLTQNKCQEKKSEYLQWYSNTFLKCSNSSVTNSCDGCPGSCNSRIGGFYCICGSFLSRSIYSSSCFYRCMSRKSKFIYFAINCGIRLFPSALALAIFERHIAVVRCLHFLRALRSSFTMNCISKL